MTVTFIGMKPVSTKEVFRKYGLTPFREIFSPKMFQESWPSTIARHAILIPEVVFWLMACVSLGEGSMTAAVSSFWAPLRALYPYLAHLPVTEEAFCMARNALHVSFFASLFKKEVAAYERLYDPRYLWRGLRLLGIDGMTLPLPRSAKLWNAFPPLSNQNGPNSFPQALLVGMVGLWDGVCRRFVLIPSHKSEQWGARWLTRFLQVGDLLLGDRNFPGSEIMARVLHRRADFLFRLPRGRFSKNKRRATASGRADEWYTEISPSNHVKKAAPALAGEMTVRILEYQIPGFRPSWLITSLLDTEAFPYEEIVPCYHERWRQETHHREWKYTFDLNNLRSHSKEGILKEVFVQLNLNNAVRWITAEAAGTACRPVDLKFLEAKRLIVASIPGMAAAPIAVLPAFYQALLAEIARQKILVRPGRRYPRRFDNGPRNKGNGKFALPAAITTPVGLCEGRAK